MLLFLLWVPSNLAGVCLKTEDELMVLMNDVW